MLTFYGTQQEANWKASSYFLFRWPYTNKVFAAINNDVIILLLFDKVLGADFKIYFSFCCFYLSRVSPMDTFKKACLLYKELHISLAKINMIICNHNTSDHYTARASCTLSLGHILVMYCYTKITESKLSYAVTLTAYQSIRTFVNTSNISHIMFSHFCGSIHALLHFQHIITYLLFCYPRISYRSHGLR